MATFINYRFLGILVVFLGLVACSTPERLPPRSMGVSAGPDKVFDQSVDAIFPELAGAMPTGNNGRVGYEMVFWEYQLADGSNANLFTCVNQPEFNCEARLDRICPAGGQEMARTLSPGQVRELQCRAVGIVGPGELLPSCTEDENINELLVGLMACR